MSTIDMISEPFVSTQRGGLSAWNFSSGKRIFDALLSAVGLIFLLPLMGLIGLAVKFTSAGPILFRQQRVGRSGETFQILKFRTMVQSSGPGVTRRGDARITPMGRILRGTKLDELPQLINVLRGDMSLVGPRPDLPEFCASVPGEQRSIFALRPGVTGWATLKFRNEETLLANVPEDQISNFYVKHVLTQKVLLDLDYFNRATFFGDLKIIWQTLTLR